MDDGARTLDDSLAMVAMAAASGTTDLVATPHANLQYRFEPDVIRERLAEVSAASGGALKLHSGCDFHLSFDNIQDAMAHPRKYTINQGPYLLVEFSELLIFNNTPDIFARLLDSEMIPVITHPERNGLLRQRIGDMEKWVEAGTRVQVTAQSVLGGFGKRAQEFCHTLIERRMVHFIASDGHDIEHRPPKMDGAFAELSKRYGEAMAEGLCIVNPQAALIGERVDFPEVEQVSTSRKWYQLWK
jgi:protein-tyrosine phosphatase